MTKKITELSDVVAVIRKSGGRDSIEGLQAYKDCTPEQKAALDAIIASVDTTNPEQAMTYGDLALDEISIVSRRLNDAMTHGDNAVFSSALQDTLNSLSQMKLEDIKEGISNLAHKGSNKIAGFLASIFRGKVDPNSAEALEERIREAVFETKSHVDNLKSAQQQTPIIQERIETLRQANCNAFIGTSLFIMAGREVLDRTFATQKEMLESGVSETSEQYMLAKEFSTQLDHKLKILEQARAQSVMDTQSLNDMNTYLNEGRLSLQSLLTSEVPMIERTIATAGLAINTLRTTNAAAAFRDHLEQLRSDTEKITDMAGDAVQKGRIDHPERLQKMLDTMIEFRGKLAEKHNQQQALDEKAESLRQRLNQETTRTLAEQARYLANDNNKKVLSAGHDPQSLPPKNASAGPGLTP